MAGRLSGIFVSKLLKPRTMIAISLVNCLVSATILVIWGDTSPIGVYIGTCMYPVNYICDLNVLRFVRNYIRETVLKLLR